ncbi:hypothetical protein JSY36_04290 [Bacillus sp. H-16]|uniref:hypothetical protein n=1 Tax=Alteribacter salitolerans TaxID=2912333 RepID=UPI001965E0CD|nr:hypothetical protein [Alteribacter salitolerans]MBM7094970.1 hypothetical protein [Alteribacter salitolerans]
MRMKRQWLVIPVVFMLTVILAACGDEDAIVDYYNGEMHPAWEDVDEQLNRFDEGLIRLEYGETEEGESMMDAARDEIRAIRDSFEGRSYDSEPVQDLQDQFYEYVVAVDDFLEGFYEAIAAEASGAFGAEEELTLQSLISEAQRQENSLFDMIDDYIEEYNLEWEEEGEMDTEE